jgi:hypothetical protein
MESINIEEFALNKLSPKFREIYDKLYFIVRDCKVDIGTGDEIEEIFDDEYKTYDQIILKLIYWRINKWDEYYSEHFCQFTSNSSKVLDDFNDCFKEFKNLLNDFNRYFYVNAEKVYFIVRSIERDEYEDDVVLINIEPVIDHGVYQIFQVKSFELRIDCHKID